MQRRRSRQVTVGKVTLGGGAPVSVQTMTKAPAGDAAGTLAQIREAAAAGCDIVRVAVPTVKHLDFLAVVVNESPLPVVADIHFDWRVAAGAVEAGAAKIRINPGNMCDWNGLREVARLAQARQVPIRIGLNSGSVKHKNADDSRPIPQALAEEALLYAGRFEEMGFRDLVLSLKASTAFETVEANRIAAARCDYPIHLGVTAAGPEDESLLKSAVALGALFADGIGDTIRLSFTGAPVREVLAGRQLLRAAGLLRDGPEVISCPTCGRCTVDLPAVVASVRERLRGMRTPLTVAVMGCEVNGPGEAKEADLGIAAAGGRFVLFIKGRKVRVVPAAEAAEALAEEIAANFAGGEA